MGKKHPTPAQKGKTQAKDFFRQRATGANPKDLLNFLDDAPAKTPVPSDRIRNSKAVLGRNKT
ncbi:MAG TPA: hypothetical protein VMS78_01780 [Rhizomicrobium sp.]|nr:hypothetical protein [Rhizomicrobium sp.]